jgi:hypothetical protein
MGPESMSACTHAGGFCPRLQARKRKICPGRCTLKPANLAFCHPDPTIFRPSGACQCRLSIHQSPLRMGPFRLSIRQSLLRMGPFRLSMSQQEQAPCRPRKRKICPEQGEVPRANFAFPRAPPRRADCAANLRTFFLMWSYNPGEQRVSGRRATKLSLGAHPCQQPSAPRYR